MGRNQTGHESQNVRQQINWENELKEAVTEEVIGNRWLDGNKEPAKVCGPEQKLTEEAMGK